MGGSGAFQKCYERGWDGDGVIWLDQGGAEMEVGQEGWNHFLWDLQTPFLPWLVSYIIYNLQLAALYIATFTHF